MDLKAAPSEAGIAPCTLEAIAETINNKQQVLVFLNRRGFAPALLCHQCGWTAECHQCDARLTVHRIKGSPDGTDTMAGRFAGKYAIAASANREAFAIFIARQAAIVLDATERKLQGGR